VFSGIIETVGRVADVAGRAGSKRIGIASELPVERMQQGESVAVDGVCLTVVAKRGNRFFVDAVQETLNRTTLGRVRPGLEVNLERALRLGDRLGGHLVQGHVDCVSRVRAIRRAGDDYRVQLELPDELRRFVALKGSVTLQGISLTVAALDEDSFEVALIPETLRSTTLGETRAGDPINVEVDLLSRYLERLMQRDSAGPSGRDDRT